MPQLGLSFCHLKFGTSVVKCKGNGEWAESWCLCLILGEEMRQLKCVHMYVYHGQISSMLLDFFWYLKISLGFFCFCLAQFLLYCEGTRFTETKHRISMEVAESKGLPKLKYHLLPRTKGFTTAVQCLRGTGTAKFCSTCNALFSTSIFCSVVHYS